MKIHVIEFNNAEMYDEYHSWLGTGFKTFRGATEWLMDKGFKVYYTYSLKGEKELYFYADGNEEHIEEEAKIIEIDFLDK
ncbi:hypothetical protein AAXE64_07945 [Priestia megaterium]